MISNRSLSECISSRNDELVIFGADNFAQFPRRDGSIRSSCDRALPAASQHDLVVLRGKRDVEYLQWLCSLNLGPGYVVEYNQMSSDRTLSECIVDNPEPILQVIRESGRTPVYVPWFSGQMEERAAKILGADLFGATEAVTLEYNEKSHFKDICKKLNIPVVTGASFKIDPEKKHNAGDMARIIRKFLVDHETVIIRGTLGESGMSLYKTNGQDIPELYDKIVGSGEKTIIIEPFLDVISTPNDQWVIERSGNITHLGLADQVCEMGMIHIGTKNVPQPSKRINKYISQTSRAIVEHMSLAGYKGVLGIDYIVTCEGIFPVENNARFNGSSYVRLINSNLEKRIHPVECWKYLKIKTKPCSFSQLAEKLGALMYDGKKKNSVFPYNCNALGKTGHFAIILFTEDYHHLMHLEESLKELGVKWG